MGSVGREERTVTKLLPEVTRRRVSNKVKIRLSLGEERKVAPLVMTDFEHRYMRDDYVKHENANIPESASSMMMHHLKQLLMREIYSLLIEKASELVGNRTLAVAKRFGIKLDAYSIIRDKWDKIHKMPWNWYLIYCGGLKTQIIFKIGLRTTHCVSRPAKHLDSATDQLARAMIAGSFERIGAVATNDVALNLAPFVKYDNADYRTVRQQIQRFFFHLGNTERISNEPPFTNISIGIEFREKYLREYEVYYDGKVCGTALDYYDEALMVFKAIVEQYLQGDGQGQPLTFPIPTVYTCGGNLWKVLESDPELWELFWKCIAVRGSFYFLNSEEQKVFAFCCRLMYEVDSRPDEARGLWFIPPLLGSVNYVSINLPRIAFVADDFNEFFEILDACMDVARAVLNVLRTRHEYLYEIGYYPFTRALAEGDGFKGNLIAKAYNNTIATVGLAEAFSIWFLKNRDDYARELMHELKHVPEVARFLTVWHVVDTVVVRECVKFYRKVLGHMRRRVREYSEMDDRKYNIEQAPAESTASSFAYADLKMFGKLIEPYIPRGIDEHTGNVEYSYTSQNTPPYTTADLETQILIEAQTQKLYNGGVVKILQIHEPFWSPNWDRKDQEAGLEALSKLVREIMSTGIVYLAPTPVQNYCHACRRVWVGNPYDHVDSEGRPTCPYCGSNRVSTWSRIVGYYRPISNWNPAKRAEFTLRIRYAPI